MFREVVVVLDGSPSAEQALEPARAIAAAAGCPLVLARIVSAVAAVPGLAPEMSRLDARHLGQAVDYLETLKVRLRREHGVEPTVRAILGDPAQTIAEMAGDEHRLLVLTSHGAGGATHRRYGSVARYALDHCRCAILIVRVSPAEPLPRTYDEPSLATPAPSSRP